VVDLPSHQHPFCLSQQLHFVPQQVTDEQLGGLVEELELKEEREGDGKEE